MKKFAMAAVAAAAMIAGGAQAYTAGTFSNGVVVPNVIHNGGSEFTGVGLINQSGKSVGVFWTFFDQNSNHVTDGCFTMTDKDYAPFVWNDATAGLSLENERGYLVFAAGAGTAGSTAGLCSNANAMVGTTGGSAAIAAHAFSVDTAHSDVAYLPVIDGRLTFSSAATDLTKLDADSLVGVAGAAGVGPGAVAGVHGTLASTLNMRYFLDGGASTKIVVWSTGSQKFTHTVNMFDDKQNRKSVNFKLDHTELDWFDPAEIPGRPADYVDGYIEWNPVLRNGAGVSIPGSIFSYSVITAPAFGAVQSVLGFHY